jgi:hypothetical protein
MYLPRFASVLLLLSTACSVATPEAGAQPSSARAPSPAAIPSPVRDRHVFAGERTQAPAGGPYGVHHEAASASLVLAGPPPVYPHIHREPGAARADAKGDK